MPVSKLLVEGHLDSEVLTNIMSGQPAVSNEKSSKNALGPRTRAERSRGIDACYLRDRDFDFDPPEKRTEPVEDCREGKDVIGWRWCRHEIENYLLEPSIVTRASGCDDSAYRAALTDAARLIRDYQAARWAIGCTRRSLPPNYKFNTKPEDLGDKLRLPADLSLEWALSWSRSHATQFRDRICPQLDPASVHQQLERWRERLSDTRMASAEEVLVWFSGKDLMAALAPWLLGLGIESAQAFCNLLRDWIRDHPDETVAALPEWSALRSVLNQ